MSEQNKPVLVERRGPVQWITINREERRNAINESVILAIAEGFREAMDDRACRAIVLTGAGDKAFCAGADLNPNATGKVFEYDFSDPHHTAIKLFRLAETCNLPIVARVNGHVRAGGMGLLCMCDLAVSTDTATFGAPESQIGLFPTMIMPYLMRVVPKRKLLEMCITGEPIGAQEALAIGLVNYAVPKAELDAKLDWLLQRIIANTPTGIRLGKNGYHVLQNLSLQDGFAFAEAYVRPMTLTEDAREGFTAFAEKRAPNWPGR
jgi:enoyl-CoA hydratase/carnithine racemase